MNLKIELEIEVTGECTLEQARDFFKHQFAGYSLPNWEDNPLMSEDYDSEYDITNIEIEEV